MRTNPRFSFFWPATLHGWKPFSWAEITAACGWPWNLWKVKIFGCDVKTMCVPEWHNNSGGETHIRVWFSAPSATIEVRPAFTSTCGQLPIHTCIPSFLRFGPDGVMVKYAASGSSPTWHNFFMDLQDIHTPLPACRFWDVVLKLLCRALTDKQ